jgi:50S ribosomal subunit-associated GTPase HflX
VAISAVTGAGMDGLLAAIDEVLPMDPLVRTRLDLDAGDGATLAMLHEFGRVLSTRYEENRVVVEAEVPESLERRLRAR